LDPANWRLLERGRLGEQGRAGNTSTSARGLTTSSLADAAIRKSKIRGTSIAVLRSVEFTV